MGGAIVGAGVLLFLFKVWRGSSALDSMGGAIVETVVAIVGTEYLCAMTTATELIWLFGWQRPI